MNTMTMEPTDIQENSALFTVEDFENLNLTETLPKYEGEGATSYTAKGDIDKKDYLESLGIEIPYTWENMDETEILPDARALLVTAFIVTGHVLVLEQVKRDNATQPFFEEAFEEAVQSRIKQIKATRLDTFGYRQRLPNGSLMESYYNEMRLSANPEKKVSEKELQKITRYIFSQLNGEKRDWYNMD